MNANLGYDEILDAAAVIEEGGKAALKAGWAAGNRVVLAAAAAVAKNGVANWKNVRYWILSSARAIEAEIGAEGAAELAGA